jgi:hypothetical protein
MIQEEYIAKAKEIVGKNVSSEAGARFFIFGSSVLSENFSVKHKGDVRAERA